MRTPVRSSGRGSSNRKLRASFRHFPFTIQHSPFSISGSPSPFFLRPSPFSFYDPARDPSLHGARLWRVLDPGRASARLCERALLRSRAQRLREPAAAAGAALEAAGRFGGGGGGAPPCPCAWRLPSAPRRA